MANLAIKASVETRWAIVPRALGHSKALLAGRVVRIATTNPDGRKFGTRLDVAAFRALLARVVAKRCDVIDAAMLRIRHELKIAWVVVQFVAVSVMNLFVSPQRAIKNPFYHGAMFEDFALASWSPNFSVSVWTHMTRSTSVGSPSHMAKYLTSSVGISA